MDAPDESTAPGPPAPRPIDDPRAIPILTAELASLTAARALNQAEMSSRASMFVAALSGSIVAIAFVAQATDFGSETAAFALMLLPVVLIALLVAAATFLVVLLAQVIYGSRIFRRAVDRA